LQANALILPYSIRQQFPSSFFPIHSSKYSLIRRYETYVAGKVLLNISLNPTVMFFP
jgi:hypothetical protein